MGCYIGRCISVVHIRRCSAGICQNWLIAEWLGLSVTVRLGLGLGLGNGVLPFFFSFLVNMKDIICCAPLACIVDVRRQYGIVCMLTSVTGNSVTLGNIIVVFMIPIKFIAERKFS